MTDTITVRGLVATTPRHLVTSEGLAITSFRVASPNRRYDKTKGEWIEGETNWFTVTTFRSLAVHSAQSIKKGDRVIVIGTLRIRDWHTDERTGTTVDIEAASIGHDLAWGTTVFTRSVATDVADVPAVEQVSA